MLRIVLLACCLPLTAFAQEGWKANPDVVRRAAERRSAFNWEEAKIPTYTLPDVLAGVRSSEDWPERREEILEVFREHVYGRRPWAPDELCFETRAEDAGAMDGAATLRRIGIVSRHAGREHRFELALFLPNAASGPVPVFLLLNNREASNTDPAREVVYGFWPAEEVIARGYGIAAIQNNELAPDDTSRFAEGVIRLFEGDADSREGDAWGALAAWGWGASRVMDYFQTDPRIDADKVAVVGHSRGGKAALWAGAEDERFALVISNESGESGAALSRRDYGETIAWITKQFPHWFASNYRTFAGREAEMPFDQHMLLSLIAPRALYVASADEDLWADPRGEFLSLVHTSPVYALSGEPSIEASQMPPLSSPLVVGRRGYHIRPGEHNLTPYDWQRFMDFADTLWGR